MLDYQINKFPTKTGILCFSRCPNTKVELEQIKNEKFDCIFNLARELESVADIEATFCSKVLKGDIEDYSVPDDFYKFVGQVFEIGAMVADGKKVLVHCMGGHGRTSMALACISLLINKGNAEETMCLTKYNAKGPERECQKDIVRRFYKFILTMKE